MLPTTLQLLLFHLLVPRVFECLHVPLHIQCGELGRLVSWNSS